MPVTMYMESLIFFLATITTTTVTTTTLSGWFTLPQLSQGSGIFHPTEGSLDGLTPGGTIRASLTLSQLTNAKPKECTLQIPTSPLEPITVTMDPMPPMAASFIPIDNPTLKIPGTCGEPWGSSSPIPFQPSPQATMPTGGTAGWVVLSNFFHWYFSNIKIS